jgi:hypothetical protein
MDQAGLWKLFFATGLPEAYLALRGEQDECEMFCQPAKTAFRGLDGPIAEL